MSHKYYRNSDKIQISLLKYLTHNLGLDIKQKLLEMLSAVELLRFSLKGKYFKNGERLPFLFGYKFCKNDGGELTPCC